MLNEYVSILKELIANGHKECIADPAWILSLIEHSDELQARAEKAERWAELRLFSLGTLSGQISELEEECDTLAARVKEMECPACHHAKHYQPHNCQNNLCECTFCCCDYCLEMAKLNA